MTEKQEIQLRLVCAALQGGISIENICYSLHEDKSGELSLWDIMNDIAPEHFPSETTCETPIKVNYNLAQA